jgi:hypothetical protein
VARTIGGSDGMHLKPERHPFQSSGRTPKPKLAHTVGVGSNPGGSGDKISANASMKKKRPMQGPGTAT